jgi:3-(3-hydroxy-phenyl)propionate hydroxylase
LLREVAFPRDRRFGWFPHYLFYQPELERALRAGMQRYAHVELRTRCSLVALEQDGELVRLTLQDEGEDATQDVAARYVVGCDGASSTVRRLLGIGLEDGHFDEPWLVVDALMQRDVGLPEVSNMLCDPGRPTTLVPGPRNHRRWEFMLLPGEEPEAMQQTDKIHELLSRWAGPEDLTIVRAAVYRFHSLVAWQWRSGSVFLAGDAAHQTPPFLGQGMCHGIRDVENLVWKLGLVLERGASESVLDTYQVERQPHVQAIIREAVAAGREVCILDPVVAAERDTRIRAAAARGEAARGTWHALPPLREGLLSSAASPLRGLPCPQPVVEWQGQRVLLDEVLGRGFSIVLAHGVARALAAEHFEAFASLGGRMVCLGEAGPAAHAVRSIEDVTGVLDNWFGAAGVVAAIVRPDRYVFDTAARAEALPGLIDDLRSAMGLDRSEPGTRSGSEPLTRSGSGEPAAPRPRSPLRCAARSLPGRPPA